MGRNRVWLIPALILLSLPLWRPQLASFLDIELRQVKAKADDSGQHLQMEGVRLSNYDEGRLSMVLQSAGVANSPMHTDKYHLQEVECRLIDSQGGVTSIQSREALYAVRHNVITLIDDVTLMKDDYLLRSDVLRYFTSYQVVKTATPVHLFSPQGEIHGGSMMYNLRNGELRVGKRVRARYNRS
ncbi:MAG: LPS export ABC transporter periplasmic protein LptC [Thermodesulfobacteriota bacterium]